MKLNLFFNRRLTENRSANLPEFTPRNLTRRFVETGDERCPMAGIWICLDPADSPDDDAELAWPAPWMLRGWRAFHLAIPALR